MYRQVYKAGMLVKHRNGLVTWICKMHGRLVLIGVGMSMDLDWFRGGKYIGLNKEGLNHITHNLDIMEIYEYKYAEAIPFDMTTVIGMDEVELAALLMLNYNLVHKNTEYKV